MDRAWTICAFKSYLLTLKIQVVYGHNLELSNPLRFLL